jgi:MFS family permease
VTTLDADPEESPEDSPGELPGPDGDDGPPGRRARPWQALAYRDYRLLWVTHLSHTIAQQIRILLVIAWLYEATGSEALAGLIGLVQLVVQFPAILLGGTLADQLDRKWMMVLSNGLTAVLFGIVAVMAMSDALQPWHVYLAVAVTGVTHVFGSPARAALVPLTVPERHIALAVSTDVATQNMGAILGPLVFAAVAFAFGLDAGFVALTIAMIPGAAVPLFLRVQGRAEGAPAGTTIRRMIDGAMFTWRHPILPGLFLLDMGITVTSFYREILPVLVRGLYRRGPGSAGILSTASAIGAIMGSFAAIGLAGYPRKGMLVLYATFAYGFILFAFGGVSNFWIGAILIAGLGGTDSLTVAVRQATVHLTTPDHMRGRAYSFLYLTAMTANNVGTIWVGVWAGIIGASNTMLLGGVTSILATIVIWRVWRPIREYRSPA